MAVESGRQSQRDWLRSNSPSKVAVRAKEIDYAVIRRQRQKVRETLRDRNSPSKSQKSHNFRTHILDAVSPVFLDAEIADLKEREKTDKIY